MTLPENVNSRNVLQIKSNINNSFMFPGASTAKVITPVSVVYFPSALMSPYERVKYVDDKSTVLEIDLVK